jgi:5-(carboxyamino)imidazole ribonucleotide mutase
MANESKPLVAVIMGSKSDWEAMRGASETLTQFGVAHENRVHSAHRTPELACAFAAEAEGRGLEVIIAGAGGAAHLAGVTDPEHAIIMVYIGCHQSDIFHYDGKSWPAEPI